MGCSVDQRIPEGVLYQLHTTSDYILPPPSQHYTRQPSCWSNRTCSNLLEHVEEGVWNEELGGWGSCGDRLPRTAVSGIVNCGNTVDTTMVRGRDGRHPHRPLA